MFQKSIIISSILVGSVYLNGVSLIELNKIHTKPKNEVNYTMYIINSIVFTSSSIVIILCGRKALRILLE
jgi:ascorbate-specific PTS system EIIC-type component UlaA